MSVQDRLQAVQKQLRQFEIKHHRKPHSVQLLAVTKGRSVQEVTAAIDAGQKHFGENYLQEALHKMQQIPAELSCVWHFLGHIQRNKTKKIAEHFTWVHSVDSAMIAKRLDEQRPACLPPLNICIEVNLSHESNKSGIAPQFETLLALLTYCQTLTRLQVRGLMVIPAPLQDFAQQRETFHSLFLLYNQCINAGIPLDTLSMGMSDDMEAAVAEGSTLVRIGRAIFANE